MKKLLLIVLLGTFGYGSCVAYIAGSRANTECLMREANTLKKQELKFMDDNNKILYELLKVMRQIRKDSK